MTFSNRVGSVSSKIVGLAQVMSTVVIIEIRKDMLRQAVISIVVRPFAGWPEIRYFVTFDMVLGGREGVH